MKKLREDDEVIVLAGKDKGRRGYISRFKGTDRVVVDTVNMVKKHLKARREGENSHISTEEASIHISNVALVNPETDKGDKVKIVTEDGKKVRVFKSNGEKVDT